MGEQLQNILSIPLLMLKQNYVPCLLTIKQDSEHLWTFCGLVDAVEYLGGEVGILRNGDRTQQPSGVERCQGSHLGTIPGHNVYYQEWFKTLWPSDRDHISGHNWYPETLNAAYNMLVNYVNPSREQPFDVRGGGISFYNDDEDDSTRGHGRGRVVVTDDISMAVDVFRRVHMKHIQSVIRNLEFVNPRTCPAKSSSVASYGDVISPGDIQF
jgi:hypothetical protein